MLLHPSQIVVEEVPRVFRQELAQVVADTLLGPIAKRARRSGIDREDVAVQIVGADQAEAVFDQLTISSLRVVERIVGFLPGGGRPFETAWIGLAGGRGDPSGVLATIVLSHGMERVIIAPNSRRTSDVTER